MTKGHYDFTQEPGTKARKMEALQQAIADTGISETAPEKWHIDHKKIAYDTLESRRWINSITIERNTDGTASIAIRVDKSACKDDPNLLNKIKSVMGKRGRFAVEETGHHTLKVTTGWRPMEGHPKDMPHIGEVIEALSHCHLDKQKAHPVLTSGELTQIHKDFPYIVFSLNQGMNGQSR